MDNKKLIEFIEQERLQYKPEGIGGDCKCETCSNERPKFLAYTEILSILKAYDRVEMPKRKDTTKLHPTQQICDIAFGNGFNTAHDKFSPIVTKLTARAEKAERKAKANEEKVQD